MMRRGIQSVEENQKSVGFLTKQGGFLTKAPSFSRARVQLFLEKCLHPSPSLANPLNLTALRRQKGEALTFIQSSPCENVRCRSLRQGLFVQKSG